MKYPFLKIQQKEFVFFVTSLSASYLKNHVNFHFREPYGDDDSQRVDCNSYINELQKLGFKVSAQKDGIQRRLQLLKVKKITEYLESSNEAFFPNSIILSASLKDKDKDIYDCIEEQDENIGFLNFPDSIEFQIVDGQHRLAGLFRSTGIDLDNFKLPVVLLLQTSASVCAKIFADVNGNQTPVNKSNIYDLYGLMESSQMIENKQKLHYLCKSFNEEKTSPVYMHIKMLGIGRGAVSQSFFVNAMERACNELKFDYQDMQGLYNSTFYYLKAYQRVFCNQWAVLENADSYQDFLNHSNKIIKDDKSQALKTNGFGAILRAFPKVYRVVKNQDYRSYYEIVSRLKGKIDWCSEDLRKGTGDKTQKAICDILLKGMNLKMRKAIVFPTEFAIINVDYSKDELYVAKIGESTEGLDVKVLPQKGKTIDESVNLVKKSLEIQNNQSSFVIDIPDSFNENTLIHDCQNLLDVELHLINSAYPEAAFKAIKNDGIEGKIVNKDCRIYSADSIWKILEILKDGDITNYQYNYVKKNP